MISIQEAIVYSWVVTKTLNLMSIRDFFQPQFKQGVLFLLEVRRTREGKGTRKLFVMICRDDLAWVVSQMFQTISPGDL